MVYYHYYIDNEVLRLKIFLMNFLIDIDLDRRNFHWSNSVSDLKFDLVNHINRRSYLMLSKENWVLVNQYENFLNEEDLLNFEKVNELLKKIERINPVNDHVEDKFSNKMLLMYKD